jgi:hypothetical protein
VRQTVAPDPDPAKVEAALDLWRKALAGKLAGNRSNTEFLMKGV